MRKLKLIQNYMCITFMYSTWPLQRRSSKDLAISVRTEARMRNERKVTSDDCEWKVAHDSEKLKMTTQPFLWRVPHIPVRSRNPIKTNTTNLKFTQFIRMSMWACLVYYGASYIRFPHIQLYDVCMTMNEQRNKYKTLNLSALSTIKY